MRLLVCDEDRCLPPKPYDLEATLKVLDGPPVAVDAGATVSADFWSKPREKPAGKASNKTPRRKKGAR